MNPWQMDLIRVGADLDALLPALVQAGGLSPEPRLDAI
jgi:hypothetical protein